MSGWSWTTWPPARSGDDLEVEAVLERVEGRRLVFAVRLGDGDWSVASGRITRVVVDTAHLLRQAGAEAAR